MRIVGRPEYANGITNFEAECLVTMSGSRRLTARIGKWIVILGDGDVDVTSRMAVLIGIID